MESEFELRGSTVQEGTIDLSPLDGGFEATGLERLSDAL